MKKALLLLPALALALAACAPASPDSAANDVVNSPTVEFLSADSPTI